MSQTHPIHSQPTQELLDAGVTPDQIAGLHQMSAVMFDDPDRVLEILGTPESRGDAALMLGAIHSYRSKSKPMPGRQKDYFEKIRVAHDGKPKPPPPMERECRDCGHVQPLSEFDGSSRRCNTCKNEIARELAAAEKANAAPKPATEEEKPMDTTTQTDTKRCSKCGETKPLDEFGKDKKSPDGKNYWCKPCVNDRNRAKQTKKNQSSGTASPQRSGQTTGGGNDTGPPTAASKPAATLTPEPDPPLSTHVDGWTVFTDPRLSDLRTLQTVLTDQLEIDVIEITLEDAAKVATAIGATFGPKESA